MLMTFALGLASVFVYNSSLKYAEEIPVNLPEIESASPIFVFPKEERFIPYCGGSVGEKYNYCITSQA